MIENMNARVLGRFPQLQIEGSKLSGPANRKLQIRGVVGRKIISASQRKNLVHEFVGRLNILKERKTLQQGYETEHFCFSQALSSFTDQDSVAISI
jgi:hypothetical protein